MAEQRQQTERKAKYKVKKITCTGWEKCSIIKEEKQVKQLKNSE